MKVDKLEADLAEGMKTVRELVQEIENRSKVMEAALASTEGGMARKDEKGGPNGKIDTRELPSWEGLQSMEFPEFAWGFSVACNGARQGLGSWAEWAAEREHLNTPVGDRDDPEKLPGGMTRARASEELFMF